MFIFVSPKDARVLKEKGEYVVNVSSRASAPFNALSPFYPHGKIPVPGIPGRFAETVEGVWQGLKDFEGEGIDETYFDLKKVKKRRGKPSGHRHGDRLLQYVQARVLLYIPMYRRMVYKADKAQDAAFELLRAALELEKTDKDVYLHDFNTNGDVENTFKPLAHASVLAKILNKNLDIIRRYRDDQEFREYYLENGDGKDPEHILAHEIITSGDIVPRT